MTREQKLKMVWKHMPKDYRGKMADGTKTVMIYRNGTCLVALENMTDAEINDRLPKEFRD